MRVDRFGNIVTLATDQDERKARTFSLSPQGQLQWMHVLHHEGRSTDPRLVAIDEHLNVSVAGTRSTDYAIAYRYAAQLTPVRLSRFAATRGAGDPVLVSWSLAGTGEPVGFRLFYALGAGSPRQPAEGIDLPGSSSSYLHRDASPGDVHYYLEVIERDGRISTFGPVRASAATPPAVFWVSSAYPNPAVDLVAVDLGLPSAGAARWVVSNVAGRRVAIRDYGRLLPGVHRLVWNGCLPNGAPAPRGVYFYRLEAADRVRTGKIVLRAAH